MVSSDSIKISVVVPCYNRADTVEEAIQSVLDQEWPALEVIAVDDRSTDDTLAVLQKMRVPNLRVVQNINGSGVSSARNLGIKSASRDANWIAFQDSDDVWLPGKLKAQVEGLLAKPDHVASYCGMVVKADTNPQSPVENRFPAPSISPCPAISCQALSWGAICQRRCW